MDDCSALIQCTDKKELQRLTQCMLHTITSAFSTTEETRSIKRPPILSKKLEEEEEAW